MDEHPLTNFESAAINKRGAPASVLERYKNVQNAVGCAKRCLASVACLGFTYAAAGKTCRTAGSTNAMTASTNLVSSFYARSTQCRVD